MAGIASIPPKHLTARAYEWLTQAPSYYSKGGPLYKYKAPLGVAACHKPLSSIHDAIEVNEWHRAHPGWCCGVEDIRSLYIGMKYTIKWIEEKRYERIIKSHWGVGTITSPTCIDCLVLMDKAMEHTAPKTGEYVIAVPDDRQPYFKGPRQHRFVWVRGEYKGQNDALQEQEAKSIHVRESPGDSKTMGVGDSTIIRPARKNPVEERWEEYLRQGYNWEDDD